MKTINSLFVAIALMLGTSLISNAQTARLQVIHNSPDAAAAQVDVYLNGSLELDDFAFRTATPFINAPAGVTINIGIALSNSMSVNDTIVNFPVVLTASETYVAIASGIVNTAAYTAADPFNLHIYAGARESANMMGNTDVLVFHGSSDAPTVDAVETHFPAGTVIDNLALNMFSGYAPLGTNDYILDITDDMQSTTVVRYRTPLASLGLQDAALTVVASGFLNPAANNNGPAFGLYVALPSGGALIPLPMVEYSQLQVIHNSADAVASVVDVYRNDELLIDDFAFRTASPFVNIAADIDHVIGIAPANSMSSGDAIATFNVNTMANESYIAIASGIVDAPSYTAVDPFNLHIYSGAKQSADMMGNTDVLVFHGSSDAPTVDAVETHFPAGTIIDNLALNMFSGYAPLGTNDYILDITDDMQSTTVVRYRTPLASLGLQDAALTVVASGFLNPAANNNGPAFGMFVALPSGGALIPLPTVEYSELQVIHNSADLAANMVDVYRNDELLIDDFEFRTATPFVQIAANIDHTIGIAPSNSMSAGDAIATFNVNTMANESYIAIASGIVSPAGYNPMIPFDLYIYSGARQAASMTGNTDVLVFHGSTDAPTVDVVESLRGAGTLVDDANLHEYNGYLELMTDDYVLDITTSDQSTVVASYQAPLMTLGLEDAALVVLASGFLNPANNSNGEAFGLYVALPSGGDLIPLPMISTGLNEETSSVLNMYPNPTTDFVNVDISVDGNSSVNLLLFDNAGRMIKDFGTQEVFGQSSTYLDLSDIPAGSYFMMFQYEQDYEMKALNIIK